MYLRRFLCLACLIVLFHQGASAQSMMTPLVDGDPDFGSVNVYSSVTFGNAEGLGIQFNCPQTKCNVGSITSVAIVGSQDFHIVTDGCTGFQSDGTIGSNLCIMQVKFTPTFGGFQFAELVFQSAGTTNSSVSIPLSGTGVVSGTFLPTLPASYSICMPILSALNMGSMALQESVPVVGAPFSLNYSSDRLRGASSVSPMRLGLGGWTPSIVHYYDSIHSIIYSGNGGTRSVTAVPLNANFYYASDATGSEIYYFFSNGALVETQDALTGLIKYSFAYDPNGRLTSILDQFGNLTQFSYSSGVTTIISPYGQQSLLTYDAHSYLASVTDPAGGAYKFTSDVAGNLLTMQKPMGQMSSRTYDSNGSLLTDQGDGGFSASLNRIYDPVTKIQTVQSTSALNRATSSEMTLTLNGANQKYTAPYGGVSQFINQYQGANSSVDDSGQSSQSVLVQDPRFGWMAPYAQTSNFSVPNSNIQISAIVSKSANLLNPANPRTFTVLNTTTTLQNDPNKVFSSTYQAANKQLTFLSPMQRATYETLNANGQLASLQVGDLLPINLTYDSHGRMSSVTQGDRRSSLTYDQYSNVASSTDSLGRITSFKYDSANRMTLETLPNGSFIGMSFDLNGNIKSITPPGRSAHVFSYNLLELVGSYLPPSLNSILSGSTDYTYNFDKQLTQISRPDGAQVYFDYGSTSGLLNSVTVPNGKYSFTYMPYSNLVSSIISPDSEVLSFQYAGKFPTRVTSAGPVSSAVRYSYNADASLAQISIGGANAISFSYDKDNRLTAVGNEVLTINSNGQTTASNLGKIAEVLDYNSYGEAISDKYNVNNKTLFQLNYTRDNLGRISSIKKQDDDDDIHESSFTYDAQGRLTAVSKDGKVERTYQYDQNGNRIALIRNGKQINAIYDAQDRLVRYGDINYQYNANGDLTKKIEHERVHEGIFNRIYDYLKNDDDQKITKYSYDAFGNLKEVILPEGKKITYIIDGQNRRIGKRINEKLIQGFVYQSQTQIAAELDGDGKVVKQFIYGSKSNVPDHMIYKGKEYRIISDQVGTPKLIVDATNGKILERISMDEFGFAQDDDEKQILPFGFAGGLIDRDTGFVKFGARDYDPETGRWLSKDPILFDGGDTNLYGYVANDPINFVDPMGLYTEIIGWNGVGSGSSSFGHISVNINGTSYSFGPGGLDVRSFTDYLGLNGFRSGTGIILNLTPGQEGAFANYLQNHSSNYGSVSNNCGNPVQNGLASIGALSGSTSILPNNVMGGIGASSNAIGQTYYPANPANAAPASPWGHIGSP